jgi:hypothetical protein
MLQTRSHLARALFMLFIIVFASNAEAQDWKSGQRINVLFGLSQPVLASGFNIEGNFIFRRFIFDFSHGIGLEFRGNTVTPDLRRQKVAVRMPWTTGFGIGYRLKEWINLRIEPKFHRFEFYYENDPQTRDNQITSFNTFTLGIGVYGSYLPFKRKDNFLKGIMISPSIRFWPTVHSTLKDGKYFYLNRYTAANEKIKTLDPGFGFTPLVVNISVGYSFQMKNNRSAYSKETGLRQL